MNALVKKIMKRYSNRARLQLLKNMPVNAICAEIGVWKGDFSEDVLRTTQPEKLYLIDPWMFQPDFADRWYGGALAKSQMDMDDIFSEVKERFASDARVTLKEIYLIAHSPLFLMTILIGSKLMEIITTSTC